MSKRKPITRRRVVPTLTLVTLLYLAAVDFLYVGRLAAYVFMTEPDPPPLPLSDDDILSDIPGLVPEQN